MKVIWHRNRLTRIKGINKKKRFKVSLIISCRHDDSAGLAAVCRSHAALPLNEGSLEDDYAEISPPPLLR
jgi:hypothetical protein